MSQEDGFDEVDDGGTFVVVELVEGFEVEAQVGAVGTALIFVEDQSVGADRERYGESSQDVEGGLAGAGFVASDLGDVDADLVGELLLGERGGLARSDQAGGANPNASYRGDLMQYYLDNWGG